ncbi:MAG: radical SAM protein, partial [Candidatus Falkowbacteria bacterium]|nr:radical SAM protein [Candidatus Falkowbacteria bacterium]
MKILFINPPSNNFTGKTSTNSPVLGVLYLATILYEHGHDANVLDADRLELTWDQLIERLKNEKPDVIGLSSTTLSMPVLNKTAEICKQTLPNAWVLVGGFGPTLEPDKTLADSKFIDIVCMGECEITIVDLIKCLENKDDLKSVRGIVFRDAENKIVKNEPGEIVQDLDTLPMPDYKLLEPSFSHYDGVHGEFEGILMPNAVMMGSRGCPHRCIFCCNAQKIPRFRSPRKIVDEIEFYKKEFKVKSVQLYDNEFIGMTMAQNKWIMEICDEIIKRGLNDLGYICQGRCSKFVTTEVLEKMYQAGFRWIWWGVEAGSQRILDRIQKDLRIEDVKHVFAITKKIGIKSSMFIMVGLPDETEEDIRLSSKLIKEVKPDKLRIHITTPLPGSKLWDELIANDQ